VFISARENGFSTSQQSSWVKKKKKKRDVRQVEDRVKRGEEEDIPLPVGPPKS
jgi:hypothetical protein